MKDEMDEAEIVSSMVDNELTDHEVAQITKRMVQEKRLMAAWERYHLISDTLKKHLPPHVCSDFSQKIAQAIEHEPAILAPHRRTLKSTPLMKQIAGLGLAASVTAIAIFATQNYFAEGGMRAPAIANVQPVPDASQFERIALPEPRQQAPANIDKYLADHNQNAPRVHGVLPYARIVGYSADTNEK